MNLDLNPAELYFTALGLRGIYETQLKKLNSMKEEYENKIKILSEEKYENRIKNLSEEKEEGDSLSEIGDHFKAMVTLGHETKVVKSLLEKINVINKQQTKEGV
ncbi:MAG: hypothetical protein O9264_13945 [Leptospira sp.]|nr:hypothetical protein [Leptospira sp.]